MLNESGIRVCVRACTLVYSEDVTVLLRVQLLVYLEHDRS